MSKKIDTSLVLNAFNKAYYTREPEKGLIFHSDQGSQYTSNTFLNNLQDKYCVSSMSGKGACWDNAVMERFFKSLKHEWIYKDIMKNHDKTRIDIALFIKFYNHDRMHKYCNYMSPVDYENESCIME